MKTLHSIAVLACIVALVAGCGTPTPQPTSAAPTQAPGTAPTSAPASAPTVAQPAAGQPTAYPAPKEPAAGQATAYPATAPGASYPAPGMSGWAADGVIGADEYAQKATIREVTVYWANDAQFLYLAAEAKGAGWLAVGIDPSDRMQGANFILAAFDGQARIMDAFGTAPVGAAHPADETLGGKNDIVAYAVAEKDGVTLFEVQIPLDSGDANDKVLEPGKTYPIIVAVGTADAFNAPHRSTGSGEITLSPAP